MHGGAIPKIAATERSNPARGQSPAGRGRTVMSRSAPRRLAQPSKQLIAAGPPDTNSAIIALSAGSLYALLVAAILLPQNHATLSIGLWPPNACAVALLMLVQLRNEWLPLAAILLAGFFVHIASGFALGTAIAVSAANVTEIAIAVGLTRWLCGPRPDLVRLGDLSRFIWAAGCAAPVVSAALASPFFGHDLTTINAGAVTWLLLHSMAMILVVPAAVLMLDRRARPVTPPVAGAAEQLILLAGGMVCTWLVFRQSALPLLFVIQPITLLHAFRLGSRGTAVFVLAVAGVAGVMSSLGFGPIVAASSSHVAQLLLLQLFVSANFLTGLPVAAILASRSQMIIRLAEGKRRLDMLASNIGDAVLHYDMARICTYASHSVHEVLGVAPEVFTGRPATVRIHPEARDRVLAVIERLYSGATERERLTYRRVKDSDLGTPVFLEADCRVAHDPESGAINGIVVALRDVTQRVELEAQLTLARERAEQAAQVKSDFLANMSHEIRTPMNGVLGFAEMMLQGDLEPEQRRFAELIVQSGRSMMMLLNDILDLSKIEAGQFTIDEGPVDLHATLAECAALHRPDAERKGVELAFECDCGDSDGHRLDESLRHWITTDGLRLRQILLNLLGNAVKFTERGSIRLSYQLDDEAIRISVSDTGIGIAPDRLESIFTPFNQCGEEVSRRFGGTGLGLSISRKLADLLGGDISVESEPGEGSCFTLDLPARLVPMQSIPQQHERPPATPLNLPPAARILLAEDHDVNRLLMNEMLERCGQTVAIAYDGTETISMVIDSMIRGRPYDLVLMDVQMPGCDGYSAARAIRAEGIGPDILPIIALTANAFPNDIAAARSAGMQAHLAKPVMMADLARALQRWLPTTIIEASSGAQRIKRSAAPPEGTPHRPGAVGLGGIRIAAGTWAQWAEHRALTMTAVAESLDRGEIRRKTAASPHDRRLMLMIHNLAGTAAAFGEMELGKRAAALEKALRKGASREECEMLARDLLALRDDAAGRFGNSHSPAR